MEAIEKQLVCVSLPFVTNKLHGVKEEESELLSRFSNISRSSVLAVLCEPATTAADLNSVAECGPTSAGTVHQNKDPVIIVQIARVLDGRSEGVETLHYISSAHVKTQALMSLLIEEAEENSQCQCLQN